MNRYAILSIAGAIVVSGASAAVYSSIIAMETFDYDISHSAALGGLGSATGGWGGAWSSGGGLVVDVSHNPLSAAGVTGTSQALLASRRNDNVLAQRALGETVSSDQDIWISYLLRYESGTHGDERVHLFNTQRNWDHGSLGVQTQAGDGGDFRTNVRYGNASRGGPSLSVGETVLIVARLTSDGSDWTALDLWVNPNAEMPTGSGDVSQIMPGNSAWQSLPGIGLTARARNDEFLFDRIMISTSFEAIGVASAPAAIPEPTGALMVLLGSMVGLMRRRVA